jgi:hypothetical protein
MGKMTQDHIQMSESGWLRTSSGLHSRWDGRLHCRAPENIAIAISNEMAMQIPYAIFSFKCLFLSSNVGVTFQLKARFQLIRSTFWLGIPSAVVFALLSLMAAIMMIAIPKGQTMKPAAVVYSARLMSLATTSACSSAWPKWPNAKTMPTTVPSMPQTGPRARMMPPASHAISLFFRFIFSPNVTPQARPLGRRLQEIVIAPLSCL